MPFSLPEFAPRTTWASAEAREVWQPRIQRVSAAWQAVERESVAVGIRPSALQNVTPEDLPALMKAEAARGLTVLPLAQCAKAVAYQSTSVSLRAGAPFDYRCAITRLDQAADWAQAWAVSDDNAIGELLGTPECCRTFFERIWKQERWMDPTAPMLPPCDCHLHQRQVCDVCQLGLHNVQNGLNMLWRWHGVRPVSHLPCSFDCPPSIALAHRLKPLLAAQGFIEEGEWFEQILSWPVLYTSLHGIAEITTPICRTSVPTDALSDKLTIQYQGSAYPAEGAAGISFPHQRKAKAAPLTMLRPASDPADNGFSSLEAMRRAHDALLKVIGGPWGCVVDLGCGDGTLLSRVPCKRRVGLEIDPARAKKAEGRLNRVVVGDCTDKWLVYDELLFEEGPDLIIAQRDRNPPDTLKEWNVLSYSYEGQFPIELIKRHAL